jgi:CheY-like chemotaxis protein
MSREQPGPRRESRRLVRAREFVGPPATRIWAPPERLAPQTRRAPRVLGTSLPYSAKTEGKQEDVLVSDISMPDVDGYALLRAIQARSLGDAPILPVIAVTANARPADRERALAAGHRLHLSKPVDEGDQVAAVADLAGRLRGRAAKRPSPG